MKNFFAILLISLFIHTQAMSAILPLGTAIHIQPNYEIDADKIKQGDPVEFNVVLPVKVNDKVLIKPGTLVTAQIIKKRNNFIFGVPGYIEAGNFRIHTENNEVITLRGTISDEGNNRYWCHIGWAFLFPVLFLKGDDGKIPMNVNHVLYTAEDVKIK